MDPVLAISGKDHILGYVRGMLEDEEEKQDIESLVESDPRAAEIVFELKASDVYDPWAFDEAVPRRLSKLRHLSEGQGVLVR